MARISFVMLAVVAAAGGCGTRALIPKADGGGGTAGGGIAGFDGGPIIEQPPPPVPLSDFEDIAAATIVRWGSPPRNGTWYTYNDATPCSQKPAPMDTTMPYVGEAPPTLHDGATGLLALHGLWSGCRIWGAGIGADLNVPIATDGAIYTGPKRPYDLTPYIGITFWAMAMPGSDTYFRFRVPMRATTRIEDGGLCDESVVGAGKCGDDWGLDFTLPTYGVWKQITLLFAWNTFHPEGWGALIPWNPADVTSIQIQSGTVGGTYDFWIDDIYLLY